MAQSNDQPTGVTRPLGRHPARRTTAARWALGMAVALAGISAAQATVLYEAYRGNKYVPNPPPVAPTPFYDNYAGAPQQLNNLIALSANAANAESSGTDPSGNIDWYRSTGNDVRLCDSQRNPGSPACVASRQGRVVYAVIKMPTAGNYQLAIAHDDDVKIDLAPVYSNTAAAGYRAFPGYDELYRNDSYVLDAGGVPGEQRPNNAGAPVAGGGTCYAVRIYWNNRQAASFLNLYWTPPGATQVAVPASALFDPSDAASYADCPGPQLTVNQSVSNANAAAGDTVNFPVTVSNAGLAPSDSDPVVTYQVPAGLNVTNVAPGAGWACTPTSGNGPVTIACTKTGGTVAAGAPPEPVATITATKTGAGQVTTNATITAGDPSCAATPAPGRCSAPASTGTTPVGSPNLQVHQTVSNPNAGAGDPVTYTVTVDNTGTAASDPNPAVAFQVPAGLTVNSATPGAGWTCTPTTGTGPMTINCTKTGGSVASGANGEPVLTVNATKTVPTQLTTTASVTAGDPGCAATPAPQRCAAPATTGAAVVGVPVNSPAMLVLLALLTLVTVALRQRAKGRR